MHKQANVKFLKQSKHETKLKLSSWQTYLVMRKDSASNSGPDSCRLSHKWGGLGCWRKHCSKWKQHQRNPRPRPPLESLTMRGLECPRVNHSPQYAENWGFRLDSPKKGLKSFILHRAGISHPRTGIFHPRSGISYPRAGIYHQRREQFLP